MRALPEAISQAAVSASTVKISSTSKEPPGVVIGVNARIETRELGKREPFQRF